MNFWCNCLDTIYSCSCLLLNENRAYIYFSFITNDRVSSFWASVFVLSKVPELGDTFFILLRKQPLIFLHW